MPSECLCLYMPAGKEAEGYGGILDQGQYGQLGYLLVFVPCLHLRDKMSPVQTN